MKNIISNLIKKLKERQQKLNNLNKKINNIIQKTMIIGLVILFSSFIIAFLGMILNNSIILSLFIFLILFSGLLFVASILIEAINKIRIILLESIFEKEQKEFLKSIKHKISFFEKNEENQAKIRSNDKIILEIFLNLINQSTSNQIIDILESMELIEEQESLNKVMTKLIEKYYPNENIAYIIFGDYKNLNEKNKILRNKIDSNKKYHTAILNYNFSEIYNKCTLNDMFNFEYILNRTKSSYILEKILKDFQLKEVIEIIFENENKKFLINETKLLLWNFFNGNNIENIISIKEVIINKVLEEKNIENINGYEKEFFQSTQKNNIYDKKLLLLMEEKFLLNKKIQKTELNIINI